ncbi:hypothetical protein [Kordiimonas gwangyangensis]|uniref:hypothetical protein n=1 Tax=Kordiimonas gwangyangensis TaxID=288022 RepID=UPI00037E3E74|nr:hypothetical protein [Kordiimonas gwangyangensis]
MKKTQYSRRLTAALLAGLASTTSLTVTSAANANDEAKIAEILARLERLEAENKELRQELVQIRNNPSLSLSEGATENDPGEVEVASSATEADASVGTIKLSHRLSYDMLDPTTRINRKQELLLEARQDGSLPSNSVIFGGAITAIADYWHSNRENKFGYLMRHPTPNNQQQNDVSEAVLHSAQLSMTATLGDWVTTYAELLYDPEQSFGAGTITAISRNQVQLRKGYVVIGNLDETPFYLTLGKMATPFGLTDTVNPFSSSTFWHAFGGLAYGAKLTYHDNGLNVSVEAVQGGAQFRAANMPNNGTAVPSKLNNYVIDANYTYGFGDADYLLVGGSYQRGSAYCQTYPVTHFNPCPDNNPAWAAYAQLQTGPFQFIGEFGKTTKVWEGTFNPTPPLDRFEASKVSSLTLGGKYTTAIAERQLDLSLEFSNFRAGPNGAPWEKQDQWVLGAAHFITPSVKGFVELLQINGYAPLNFISGGNVAPGATHSDIDTVNRGVIIGVNAAF